MKTNLHIRGDFSWKPCQKIPKVNEIVWWCRSDNKPREVKINKKISEKKFRGTDIQNKEDIDIDVGTDVESHIWSYEKPVRLSSPTTTDLKNAPQSTPVDQGRKFSDPLSRRSNSKNSK